MDRAYMFPINVRIKKENIAQATMVSIDADYYMVYQAASHDRLRCIYAHCFGPLNPVRRDADVDVIGHFAHREPEAASPECPYRTLSWGPTPPGGGGPKYRHNIRKLIESRLHDELLRKLGPRAKVTMSGSHEREPRILIDGLARPLLILSIAPHEENLWRDPFDGTVEGRQVLFFISSLDLPKLAPSQGEIDRKLLAKSSTITVFLPGEDAQDYSFTILDKISRGQTGPGSSDPLDQLNLIYVDYKKLFALERESEFLFIKTSQKSPIEYIEKQLGSGQPPLARKLLQLFVKRLLVDSTSNQRIAFGQELVEARQFFRACNTFPKKEHLIAYEDVQQIMTNAGIHDLIKEQPLWSLYEQLLLQTNEAMCDSIKSLEDEQRNLAQQWATQRKEMQDSIRNLEAKSRDLEQQLEEKRREYEKESIEMQGTIRNLEANSRDLGQQLEEKRREYEGESARRKQLEGELEALTGQLAEADMAKEELNKRLRAKEKEFDAEQGRRQKLEDALEKLRKVPLSRQIFKYYEIEVD